MNKKLLAVAVTAALAVPAVNANADTANVTVYGKLHVSIDQVDADNGSEDETRITSRASRLGFKGSEKLGNGLKAVWKAEFGINMTEDTVTNVTGPTDPKDSFTSRDHYLGLAGDFGTVLLAGNVNTPYKNSTGKMDFFGDTLADYNNTVGFDDQRADNAIVYLSPKFNGLSFAAALLSGENTTSGDDSIADFYSVAVTYKGNGLHLAAAYEDLTPNGGADDQKYRLGAMYSMNAFKVAAVFENDEVGTADTDRFQLSGAYTMGNNTVKAMWGQSDNGTTESDGWAVGLDHKLSKRTKVYGLYTDSENGTRGESSGGTGGAGSGFSLGMIHSF